MPLLIDVRFGTIFFLMGNPPPISSSMPSTEFFRFFQSFIGEAVNNSALGEDTPNLIATSL